MLVFLYVRRIACELVRVEGRQGVITVNNRLRMTEENENELLLLLLNCPFPFFKRVRERPS